MVGSRSPGDQPPGGDVGDDLRADLLERGDAGGEVDLELRGHARDLGERLGGLRCRGSPTGARRRGRRPRPRRSPGRPRRSGRPCRRSRSCPAPTTSAQTGWTVATALAAKKRHPASVHASDQLDPRQDPSRRTSGAGRRRRRGRCRDTAGRRATRSRTPTHPRPSRTRQGRWSGRSSQPGNGPAVETMPAGAARRTAPGRRCPPPARTRPAARRARRARRPSSQDEGAAARRRGSAAGPARARRTAPPVAARSARRRRARRGRRSRRRPGAPRRTSRGTVRSGCRSTPAARSTGSGDERRPGADGDATGVPLGGEPRLATGDAGPAVRTGRSDQPRPATRSSDEHEPEPAGHREPPCINQSSALIQSLDACRVSSGQPGVDPREQPRPHVVRRAAGPDRTPAPAPRARRRRTRARRGRSRTGPPAGSGTGAGRRRRAPRWRPASTSARSGTSAADAYTPSDTFDAGHTSSATPSSTTRSSTRGSSADRTPCPSRSGRR